MTRGEIMRGLSMAMTLQNVTTERRGAHDRSMMNARYVNCSSDGKWAGPFYNVSDRYYGTGITPEDANHNVIQPDFTKPFEIHVRAKLNAIPPTNIRAFLCGTNASGFYWANPSFEFRSNEHIFAGFSVNGRDWTEGGARIFVGGTQHPEDNIPVTTDSVYDITYEWTGDTLAFEVSDGHRKVVKRVPITTPHYQNATLPFVFGNNAQTRDQNSGLAMLDMEHTYIKVNGVPIWGAGY